ncbi:MAG: Methionine synthase (cobalamin-dependent), methyltransferase domain [Anaerocolumna sp.]|jgi:homocysteine S-methyltransferase|nr:Methionine synthase (cobalamin-dependent), methyltransferase domain [Anaerocolumna sp.]
MNIKNYLQTHKLLTDGAMGTYYSRLLNNENAVSEFGNLYSKDIVLKIHKEYIRAGAGLIRTNSFAANRQVLNVESEELKKIIKNSYRLAKQAVKEENERVYIACDIGPIPENGTRSEEEILTEYKEMCDIFLKEGGEIFLFETFSDFYFLKDIVTYVKEKAPNSFIITNFCLNKNGFTSKGLSAKTLLKQINDIKEIDAGGFNCGIGSGHMYQILKKLNLPKDKYIFAMPNAGYPEQFRNRLVFMNNEAYFVENMKRIVDLGMDVVGGCCGTTPGYIKNMADKLALSANSHINRTEIEEELDNTKAIQPNEFYELFSTGKKVVAVELDPPFDASDEVVTSCAHKLKNNNIDIITMADSPMGRSRVDSVLMSLKLSNETDQRVMPHICCRDKNMIAMRSMLLGAYINGIRNVLIVTGDPIPSEHRSSTTGVFDYNSIQLMNYVKEMNREHFKDDPIYYGGALNYARGPIEKVIERMEKKIEAGAKYFLTQPVYSDEDIKRLEIIKSKVDTKILCGIMPLVSYTNANFIKNEITGIFVPDQIVARYRPDMTKEEAEWVAAEITSEIIEKLKDFVDGYYFMLPFNRVSLMDKIRIQ